MKQNRLLSVLLLLAAAAGAQTTTTPATTTPKPAGTVAKPATTTAKSTTAVKLGTTATHTATATTAVKLPPGVPPVKGIVKPAFALRYEDIAVGTGADAAPNKLYKVNYTGYLGLNGRPDDGRKFDSSYDRRMPKMGADGKPQLDADGKPVLGDPQPIVFPQGMGRLIPGFDQGFEGMKVGGKRRLFIPWQLAYGAAGRQGPDPAHPGIPAKADLIFDIELVDVADLPAAPPRPPMPTAPARPMGSMPMPPQPGSAAPAQPASGAPPAGAPIQPATTAAPATPAQPATPPQPQGK